ncbi:MAG: electron transfer flavoprotein subunit alpha/FixB family protein [Xanthomonadaceae bacterium]|nr:electron transfer flavoprotein subunit alpha/FixB family protein [Xanthomonadaceae bacterium]
MSKIFVVVEHRDGKLKKVSFELLGLASQGGNEAYAILLGEGVTGLAGELAHYGAKKVFVSDSPTFKYYSAEAYSKAVVQIATQNGAEVILTGHTPTGKDFMPHVAAKLNVGLASDCTQISISGTTVTARRPVYAGKATAEVEFLGSGVRLATVRANSIGIPKPDTSKTAETSAVTIDIGQLKTKVLEVVRGAVGRPDVTEAAIVISGGRSLKSAENFKILEDCADVLGAGVGASRAAVDAGFRPHRDQVGQTGKTVSPALYIACGISGAIQHLAGMRTSKTIVAINTDPQAPIFQVADYGIVGDLFAVVPELMKEFKNLKEH